ncbi:phosphate ABC transporter substrate-binding protein PstS [Ferroacidibacillus organovorans]|nr:phosphate ABC transporter substrate-binding protein PstS [Ferroacidibacillus organovorans]
MMMGGVGQAFAKTNVVKHSVKHASGPVVHLQETGSTLLWPLFQLWVPVYKHVNSKVDLTTAGTGSGVGISQASDGTVQIGASDAYMSNRLLSQHPGMLNIPMAISAQQIMYNIPGVKKGVHLHLTGNVIAQIYLGKIRYWNAPQIQSLNKGVKLPHWMIVPIHRTDGSGDTFLFTQFMTDTNAAWSNSVQYGTSVSWPAIKGALGANGNNGVVALASKTPGSIAYVGISWLNNGLSEGLGEAALQNRAGRYLLPNPGTIAAAANMMIGKTPADERTSLIYAPGANSYPIINYEYAIINEKQANPATATAVKNLLLWAISPQGGNKAVFMDKVHFLPLPASIAPLSRKQIAKIHG